jgi:hypothetical protein
MADQRRIENHPALVAQEFQESERLSVPSSEAAEARANASDSDRPYIEDFNREIYYRNKLEFAFDAGWLGYNTPLILDPLIGQAFHAYPGLPGYNIIPLIWSVRWHLYDISGRLFWRGNTDASLGLSYNIISAGPESFYAAVIAGLRYNFIQPNWRIVPYLEARGGLGWTNAKQPYEKHHGLRLLGQGQDLTFTFMFGGGARYNFNPEYSVSAACSYMHISNMYLSEPAYYNHGINVVGATVGLNVAMTRASLDRALDLLGLRDQRRWDDDRLRSSSAL